MRLMTAIRDRLLASPFSYQDDDEYKEAQEYAQAFVAQDEVDYDWVYSYSEWNYDRFGRAVDSLDEKADSIIKYLGGFSGLASVLGAYLARSGHWYHVLSVLPLFALALYAIRKASAAKAPMDFPFPPSIKDAIRYANAYGEQARATFIPQLWAASVGAKAVLTEKALLIGQASSAFVWAVVCILIPLAVLVWRR